jgi:hypothetical protein
MLMGMKIAFITGCLEPGRDGVGDYTRLLAEECVRQGHQCCLIALSDRYIYQAEISTSSLTIEEMPILRLCANVSWEHRAKRAQDFLSSIQPDWVSLQFVPYGYQDKGIVAGLSHWLRLILQGRQVHVMFHELWIGQNIGAPLKEKIVGKIQRFFISRVIKALQPVVIHTSNLAYIMMLQQLGVSAKCLPLFSNIPISAKNADDWLLPQLRDIGLKVYSENRDQFWLFGIFGTIHSAWSAEPLFTYLNQAGIQNHRKIIILSIGRLGYGETIWKQISQTYCHQFSFLQLNEQLPHKISEFLNSIDFGISTSPYLLVGKSGTTTAMLEHGIPVIINRDDFKLSSCSSLQYNDPLLFKMDNDLPDSLINKLTRKPTHLKLPDIANSLISELTRINGLKQDHSKSLATSLNT